MARLKTLSECMAERGVDVAALLTASGLDRKVVEAIVEGRYLTSPKQRQRLAAVLHVAPDEIHWGGPVPVDHMYGHGPQFGRSP